LREEAAAAGGGGTRLGYARGLFENARARTDAERYGGFQRAVGDETAARDFILRRATLFIKLLTSFFARDYPLARFLRAREELAVKSAVSREIVVESRIR
jgi:hypothetical protein